MPITVSMIENKEFKTKMRGYDPEEVDIFLDEICDEMVAMQEEILSLQSRLSRQSAAPQPAPVPAPVPFAPVVEKPSAPSSEAAQKLMASAQKVYDEMVADAKREADEILSGARSHANVGLEDLEKERDQIKDEIAMLKDAARDYRNRFRRLVEDQQHVLKDESALFED